MLSRRDSECKRRAERIDSYSVTSPRGARIFEIIVNLKYEPEAQASAYPGHSMNFFIV